MSSQWDLYAQYGSSREASVYFFKGACSHPQHTAVVDRSVFACRLDKLVYALGFFLTRTARPKKTPVSTYETRPPWVSNGTGAVEAVSFTEPIAGVYQMEVFGYTATTFRLVVDIDALSGALSGTPGAGLHGNSRT